MQARACKGKAKIAVLAHELLSLDLSLPTSSSRAAQALQLQREASITTAESKAPRTAWFKPLPRTGSHAKRRQGISATRRMGEISPGHMISRSYSASAAMVLDTQEPHNVDYVNRLPTRARCIQYQAKPSSSGSRSVESLRSGPRTDADVDDDPVTRLRYAVRCLDASQTMHSNPLQLARMYFDIPEQTKMAMSVRLSRKVLRAIATAVIQTRDPAVLVELQEGLRALPMEAFLDRLTDIPLFVKRSQHDTVDALVLVWIKALLHARMPDLADQLYESATIRGYFCSDKLDIDAVVGPLVDLKEWALVLKWTQGRICSVGVHAMRMRAFSSLGTPQLAIADYEEHHRELQAESRTMTEGMKAYYLTRNFDRANAIQRELSRQGKTRGHLYIFGMIDVLQRLGYTPLLEKAILEDLQLIGASHHHVPLLNTLLKFRIKNCLSILPIMENYPTAGPSVDLQTANQPPILLDQCTLALILDDARHLTDLAHLSKMWQEILSGLPGNHISSNLLGALIRSLLRLNSSEDALQLLQDVQARKTSKWIDRPAVLHTTVFDNLIGYISRKQGFDAVIPIFDLMRSAGLHPGRKTISCLVDGLSQHLALKPRIQFDFHQNILRILSSKLWADGPEHDLQLGSPTALRNHQMQEEIDSLLGDQLEGNAPEWPNVFEWAHLAKQVKSAKSEGNAKSSKGFPLLKWTDTSSPAPDAIFAATLDKGFRLDISTCKAMLHMYLSRGHIDRAQEIMLLAWQRGITPSTEMWSTFVEGLETADQLESLNRRIQALSRNASPDGTVAMLAGGSRSSAALMPNQAMWTEIIRELVNRGAFRQACQVVKCALACALRTEDSPDVGLVSVSFEALVRARQTIKAAALLKDSPLGFGDKLRTARGASKSVLLKALRRARAWHLKHGEPDLVSDIDVFLKSMPRFPVAESSEAAKGKHVKRGGFTLGELKGLEEQIGRMFHRLWPDEKRRDEGRPRQHTL